MAAKRAFAISDNAKIRSVLEELMRSRGWGQRGAAVELGVTQQQISSFLAGRTNAGFGLATRVAKAAGKSLDDLLASSEGVALDAAPSFADRLDHALAVVFTHKRHSLRELDAVRVALRGMRRVDVSDARLESLALEWLDSAARLIADAREVTLESLLVDITGTYVDHVLASAGCLEGLHQQIKEADARAAALSARLPAQERTGKVAALARLGSSKAIKAAVTPSEDAFADPTEGSDEDIPF